MKITKILWFSTINLTKRSLRNSAVSWDFAGPLAVKYPLPAKLGTLAVLRRFEVAVVVVGEGVEVGAEAMGKNAAVWTNSVCSTFTLMTIFYKTTLRFVILTVLFYSRSNEQRYSIC